MIDSFDYVVSLKECRTLQLYPIQNPKIPFVSQPWWPILKNPRRIKAIIFKWSQDTYTFLERLSFCQFNFAIQILANAVSLGKERKLLSF